MKKKITKKQFTDYKRRGGKKNLAEFIKAINSL